MLSKFCKNAFKDFFFFSKGERNGICVLVSLVTLMFSINFCLPIQSYEEEMISEGFRNDSSMNVSAVSYTSVEKNSVERFKINDKLEKNKSEIDFKSEKEKVHKDNLYDNELVNREKVIVDSQFVSSEKYVKKNDEKEVWKKKDSYRKESRNKYEKDRVGQYYEKFDYDTVRVYVNSADTTELKRLRGIGSVLSARIVKYRDKIGGFKSLEQIQKIYGLSEETYRSILPHLILDK